MHTVQIISGMDVKDLEGNLSNSSTHATSIGDGEYGMAARPISNVNDLDEMCFFFALCGLCTNTFLHILLVVLYVLKSAPRSDFICWSLATIFWGFVALSVHSMRQASRTSKSDPSCAHARSTQMRIAEALILAVFIAWYIDAIVQRTSPYVDLFSGCSPRSLAKREEEYACAYYWGSALWPGLALSECDLAIAISSVTWIGPIALLFATWTMLFKWISSPAETSEIVNTVSDSSASMLTSISSPDLHDGKGEHECKTTTSEGDSPV